MSGVSRSQVLVFTIDKNGNISKYGEIDEHDEICPMYLVGKFAKQTTFLSLTAFRQKLERIHKFIDQSSHVLFNVKENLYKTS